MRTSVIRAGSFVVALTFALTAATFSAETVYQLSEQRPPEHPSVVGCNTFADLVRERSDGRLVIDVHDSGKLYEDYGAAESAKRGGLAFCRVGSDLLSSYTPSLNILSVPYLFRDGEHLWKVLDGELGDGLLEDLKADGLVGLAYYDAGARGFYNSRREVRMPNYMRGLKIRVPQTQLAMAMVAALGAEPSLTALADIASSLKLGLIDGAENTLPEYQASGHWKLAGYFTDDAHLRTPDILCVSRIVWEGLSAEDKKIVREAARASQAVQREAWKEYEAKIRSELLAGGTVVVADVVSPAEWRELVRPIYASAYLGEKGRERLKVIQETK